MRKSFGTSIGAVLSTQRRRGEGFEKHVDALRWDETCSARILSSAL